MNAKQARTARRKLAKEHGHLFVALRIAGARPYVLKFYSDVCRMPPQEAARSMQRTLEMT